MISLLFRGGLVSNILVIGIAYVYWDYVSYVLLGVFMVFVLKKVIWLIQKIYRLSQNLRLQDVDSMDGISFEHYIAQLLAERGYSNVSLTEQYDYGVDIIAEKDGVRWGIQTKRYSGLVKAEAVRQVVTGLRLYGCDRAMVVTNSTYSNVAKRLAEGNDCVLIDRDGLAALAN
ncbi:MAG TPA: restriction endonuclease [Candidatus Saccharibacteria bacterium]|jgi:restriction system protein|nr:restriction endonuclease [Candidatus Saccharibacteria bacterium]